jgi:hypothetical protein
MSEQETPLTIKVLVKIAPARINPDWHYHIANHAGRPMCGALLNMRDWHLRELSQLPSHLCTRCAKSLKPKSTTGSRRIAVRIPLSATEKDADTSDQLELPL